MVLKKLQEKPVAGTNIMFILLDHISAGDIGYMDKETICVRNEGIRGGTYLRAVKKFVELDGGAGRGGIEGRCRLFAMWQS